MDGRVETTNAAGVYSDLRRNSMVAAGKHIANNMSLLQWSVGCSKTEKEMHWFPNFIHAITSNKILDLSQSCFGS